MTRVLASLRTRAYLTANNDRGATAVEYGLMVALIAVAIIGAVTLLGGNLATMFATIARALPNGAAAPAPAG
jgi:pilus assembly protein Flp/PilA